MTIAFKQVQQSGPTTAISTTVSITPSNAGDLLILSIGSYQNGNSYSLSTVHDNNSNTWLQAIPYTTAVATTVGGAVWYVVACNSGPTTITVTFTASAQDIELVVIEYSGCASSMPIDATGTGSGTTSSVSSPTISAGAGEMVVSFLPFSGNTISSIGGAYNQRG